MSGSNIVALPGVAVPVPANERVEAVVFILEKLLDAARSGRLRAFAGTGFLASGDRITGIAVEHACVWSMLGAIDWMKAEVAAKTEMKA